MTQPPEDLHVGLSARLVKLFLLSKLPPIIIMVSLPAGLAGHGLDLAARPPLGSP